MGSHKKEKKHSSEKEKKSSKKSHKDKEKNDVKEVREKVKGAESAFPIDNSVEFGPKTVECSSNRPTSDQILESLFNDVKNSTTPVDITTIIASEKQTIKTEKSKKKHKKKDKEKNKQRKASKSKTQKRSVSKSRKAKSRSRSLSRSSKSRSRSKSASRRRSRSRSSRSRSDSRKRRSRSRDYSRDSRSCSRSRSRHRSRSYSSYSRSRSRSHSRSRSRGRSRTWSRSPRACHNGGGRFRGAGAFRNGFGGRRFGAGARRFGSPPARGFRGFQHRGGPIKWRFNEIDYTDESGAIDKQKLLEIATKNATKLAMEGKLPKGVELLDTMKNKTISELVTICKQLHKEEDLMEKVSSDSDEERYDQRYERWRKLRSVDREDDEFVPRPVRAANEIKINLANTASKRVEEESKLTSSFPVSSGAHHRVKVETAPPTFKISEGGLGPLTIALGKVKTNIPCAYKPPPQPPNLFAALSAPKPMDSLASAFDTSASTPASTSAKMVAARVPPPPEPPTEAAIVAVDEKTTTFAKTFNTITAPMTGASDSSNRNSTNNNGTTQPPSSTPLKRPPFSLPPPPTPPVLSSFDNPAPSVELLEAIRRRAHKANSELISSSAPLPPEPQVQAIANAYVVPVVASFYQPVYAAAAIDPAAVATTAACVEQQRQAAVAQWPVSTGHGHPDAENVLKLAKPEKKKTKLDAATAVMPSSITTATTSIAATTSINDSAAAFVSAFSAQSSTSNTTPTNNNDIVFYPPKPKSKLRSVQELVAERLKYSNRLKDDPNDYRARKKIGEIDAEMSQWAQTTSDPGRFSGSTGARVLTAEELAPRDPKYQAWAKKDLFKSAVEVSSGVGMRLMQKMGWQPGSGLGKNGAGQLEPLLIDVKADRRGLQSIDDRKVSKKESVVDIAGKNPVSVIMEYCSKMHVQPPEFSCEEIVEPGTNAKRFLWRAIFDGVEYQPSLPSSNKKAGKSQVCMVMVEALGLGAAG